MNFTGKSRALLLVHRAMPYRKIDASVDIVLTPQFYVMKRERLPVKFAYQAKRVAASMFDGLLEDQTSYAYFVYKEADDWIFIAYDTEEIVRFLEEKGIDPQQVSKIYFAQQFLEQIKEPILLSEKEALSVIDRTVVVVPSQALETPPESTSLGGEFRPASGVKPDTIGGTVLLDKRQAIVLGGILFLFALLWFAEGARYGTKNTSLAQELEKMNERYPALQSAYTRKSVAHKYRTIDTAERKKREIVGKIAGLIFKGVTLESFDLTEEKFEAVFTIKDDKTARRFTQLLAEAGFRKADTSSGLKIVVKGQL